MLRDVTKLGQFTPTKADLVRRARLDIEFIPKTVENKRTIIDNDDICIFACMQRQPRSITELVQLIAKWRQRNNLTENSYVESIRHSPNFSVTNGVCSLTEIGIEKGYRSLRKLDIVGWLKP